MEPRKRCELQPLTRVTGTPSSGQTSPHDVRRSAQVWGGRRLWSRVSADPSPVPKYHKNKEIDGQVTSGPWQQPLGQPGVLSGRFCQKTLRQ